MLTQATDTDSWNRRNNSSLGQPESVLLLMDQRLLSSSTGKSDKHMITPTMANTMASTIHTILLYWPVNSSSLNCNRLLHCKQRRTLMTWRPFLPQKLRPGMYITCPARRPHSNSWPPQTAQGVCGSRYSFFALYIAHPSVARA